MPKPAVRSSFPLQENKNLTNEDDPSTDTPVKNNLAQLRKNFETNREASDICCMPCLLHINPISVALFVEIQMGPVEM